MPAARKRGRPRKGPSSAKTAVFSTRITPELRAALEKAASKAGGTLSDEIERRLWQSFAFEKERAKVFAAFGGGQNYAVCRIIAQFMKALASATGKAWADDPWTYEQFARGIARLLRAWRPAGPSEKPIIRHHSAEEADRLGELLMRHELISLFFTDDVTDPDENQPWRRLKTDLGTLAERSNPDGETA